MAFPMSRTAIRRLLSTAFAVVGILGGLALLPPSREMPDFSQWPAGDARKSQFFGYLQPLIEAENERVREQRGEVERLGANRRLCRLSEHGQRADRALGGLAKCRLIFHESQYSEMASAKRYRDREITRRRCSNALSTRTTGRYRI